MVRSRRSRKIRRRTIWREAINFWLVQASLRMISQKNCFTIIVLLPCLSLDHRTFAGIRRNLYKLIEPIYNLRLCRWSSIWLIGWRRKTCRSRVFKKFPVLNIKMLNAMFGMLNCKFLNFQLERAFFKKPPSRSPNDFVEDQQRELSDFCLVVH